MSKKRLKHGDILAIPLIKELGFAFAKYINLVEVLPSTRYPDMIRVYNYRNVDIDINKAHLESFGLLFSPLLIAGLRPTINKGFWSIIGNLTPSENECIIPHYSCFGPPWVSDKAEATDWYYLIDADISKKVKTSYEKVKHLEYIGGGGGSGKIETLISMAFIRKEQKNIHDYFELKEYYEKSSHEEIMNKTPYYELPNELKDRAIE